MGRELRKVILNWEHPKYTENDCSDPNRIGQYKPLFDQSYLDALNEWIEEHRLWEAGKHEYQDPDFRYYAEYNGNPPDVVCYRPDWKPKEATWFQVYETVSEGTPVSPPFASKEELIDYLCANGDFWDQQRGDKPWSRRNAVLFVNETEWAPSFQYTPETGLISGVEGLSK